MAKDDIKIYSRDDIKTMKAYAETAAPHRKNLIPPAFDALDAAGWIAPHALIVCETAKTEKLASLPDCQLILARAYGEPMLHFMVR